MEGFSWGERRVSGGPDEGFQVGLMAGFRLAWWRSLDGLGGGFRWVQWRGSGGLGGGFRLAGIRWGPLEGIR